MSPTRLDALALITGSVILLGSLVGLSTQSTACSPAQQSLERQDALKTVQCVATQLATGASDESTAINCGLQLVEDVPALVLASKKIADLPRASDD